MQWIIPTWTLIRKELIRAFSVPGQTIGAPIMSTLLYFLVFGAFVGGKIGAVGELSYAEFIMPGLILMNVMMGTFSAVASGLMLSKMMNTLSDILVTSMTYFEMVIGYCLSAVIRSALVAGLIYATSLFFIPFRVEHPWYLFAIVFLVSFSFALFGLIIGIWASSFEQISVLPTFLIQPLSFLGGVFYSVQMLPEKFQIVTQVNPLFYMINGLRYGFYGVADTSPMSALVIIMVMLVILTFIAWRMFATGYKIKT